MSPIAISVASCRSVPWAALALGVLLNLMGGGLAPAEIYRDRERHYEIALPREWRPMDAALPKKTNIQYTAGFVTSRGLMNAPYILVQEQSVPTLGASLDEIEAEVRKGLPAGLKQARSKLGASITDLDINEIIFDRDKRRILMSLQISAGPGQTLRAQSCGMIGKEKVLFFHCYSPLKQFAEHQPTFQSIQNSFCFDLGYTYEPGQSKSADLLGIARDLPPHVLASIVVGVVMIVLALLLAFRRQKTSRQTSGSSADGEDWPEEWARYRPTPTA